MTDAERAAKKAARIAAMDAPISRERIAELREQDRLAREAEAGRREKVISTAAAAAAPAPRRKSSSTRGESGGKSRSPKGERTRRLNALIAAGWWAALTPPELRVLGWVITKCEWSTCVVEMSERLLARTVVGCVGAASTGIDRLVERGVLVLRSEHTYGHGRSFELCVPPGTPPGREPRRRGGLKSVGRLPTSSSADCLPAAVHTAYLQQSTLDRCSSADCLPAAVQNHVLHSLHPPKGGGDIVTNPPDGCAGLWPGSPSAEESDARSHAPGGSP